MALNLKQRKALELLTCGKAYKYQEIAEMVGVAPKTISYWRSSPNCLEFQEELKRLNEVRWQAAEDAAREAAIELCKEKNQKMVEFVLKNAGYNPTNKVEAEVKETVIEVSIDGEDEH